MLHFQLKDGKVINVVEKYSDRSGDGWLDCHDLISYEAAIVIATLAGDQYLAIDKGEYVRPRFDVVRRPQIGDKISYGINGDYRPDGEIASISPSMKVIKSTTGHSYYRKRLTNTWKYCGSFTMSFGHHHETNPEV